MSLRTDHLREVLSYVRRARAALAARDLPDAVHWVCTARGYLAFTLGLFLPNCDVSATARLRRQVVKLESDLEAAVRPRPEAPAFDIVRDIAEGLEVLRRRDGIEIDDDLRWERGRNIAAFLLSKYLISERQPLPTPATTRTNGAIAVDNSTGHTGRTR